MIGYPTGNSKKMAHQLQTNGEKTRKQEHLRSAISTHQPLFSIKHWRLMIPKEHHQQHQHPLYSLYYITHKSLRRHLCICSKTCTTEFLFSAVKAMMLVLLHVQCRVRVYFGVGPVFKFAADFADGRSCSLCFSQNHSTE